MNKTLKLVCILGLCCNFTNSWARQYYGEKICHRANYHCYVVHQNDTWESLFENEAQRDLVQRINRMNTQLKFAMTIAIPDYLDNLSIYDISPFPRYITANGEKSIYVDLPNLAWGAYNEQGELIWWGPVSGGSGMCPAGQGDCLTPVGTFRVIRKNDETCVSTVFPMRANGESGGAIMPYCMHFWRGIALHGSEEVPGYAASHGCIRLFVQDARWLNEEFVDLPGAGGKIGTQVIVNG